MYALFQHLVYEAFFGFLVGTFATIVMSSQFSEQMKQEKIQAVREVAKRAALTISDRKRLHSYYDTMYKHTTVFDEEQLLNEMPE